MPDSMTPSDSDTSASPLKISVEDNVEVPSTTTNNPNLQRYRPIRPRPLITTPTTTILPSRPRPSLLSPPGGCGIPQCTLSPCTLSTHRQYAQLRRNERRAALSPHPISGARSRSQSSSGLTSLRSSPAPASDLDAAPTFPFDPPYPKELRQIYQFWIDDFVDRYAIVYSLPIQTIPKMAALQQLLSEEMLALIALSYAKCDLMQRADDRSFDAAATYLYSRLNQTVRQKLESLQGLDVEHLVFCVLSMANFDRQKQDALQKHRTALQHLISFRGGVHNLINYSAFILHADRRLAIMTETQPMFESRPIRARKPPAEPTSPYGAAFFTGHITSTLDAEVLSFAHEANQFISWFEESGICFDPTSPSQGYTSRMQFFYFTRDQLGADFAHVHERLARTKTRSWAVLLAAKLVEYPILYGDTLSILTEHLAGKLTAWLLKTLNPPDSVEWEEGYSDTLSWILWVLVTLKVDWTTKASAQDLLKETMRNAYSSSTGGTTITQKPQPSKPSKSRNKKGKGPETLESQQSMRPGWRGEEWDKNMKYVWSRDHLRTRFDGFCDRIDAG